MRLLMDIIDPRRKVKPLLLTPGVYVSEVDTSASYTVPTYNLSSFIGQPINAETNARLLELLREALFDYQQKLTAGEYEAVWYAPVGISTRNIGASSLTAAEAAGPQQTKSIYGKKDIGFE